MSIPRDDEENALGKDLPKHWNFGGETDSIRLPRNPRLLIQQLLCVICFGCASLQTVWRESHTPAWRTSRNDVRDRLQHINVVAGLLLATIAAFCTTEPPAGSRMLPYTKPVPYCFLMVSFGFSIVGLGIGSSAAFILHKLNPTWFCEVLMASRRRIWITMIVLSLPFFCIVAAVFFFSTGLAAASWYSEIPIVRVGLTFFWLPPLGSLAVMVWFVWFRPGALWRILTRFEC